MAITGDLKENYLGLHQSTGESFASMADRVEHPEVLRHLDVLGQEGNKELAKWLRSQTDDPEAIARKQAPVGDPNDTSRDGVERASQTGKSDTPAGRTSSGSKSNA